MPHLEKKLKLVDRVIITGDLMQSASDSDAEVFLLFKNFLNAICLEDPILIPGNHDQKWNGLIKKNHAQMSRLFGQFPRVQIEEDLEIVFYCFDSSRDSSSTWGVISTQQLRDIQREYTTKNNRNVSLASYLSIGLLHHHPFSFTEGTSTEIQKLYKYNEEKLLALSNPEIFHDWCARKKISLLMHGHKHVPRRIQKEITFKEELLDELENFTIEAIGCGTSLGAEEYPLSYNVLIWDPISQMWAITFWQDAGQGIFNRQFVKIEKL